MPENAADRCPGCGATLGDLSRAGAASAAPEGDPEEEHRHELPDEWEELVNRLQQRPKSVPPIESDYAVDPKNPWYREAACPGCGQQIAWCAHEWHEQSKIHQELKGVVPQDPEVHRGGIYDPRGKKWEVGLEEGGFVPEVKQPPPMGMEDLPGRTKNLVGIKYHLTVTDPLSAPTSESMGVHRHVYDDRSEALKAHQRALDAGFEAVLQPVRSVRASSSPPRLDCDLCDLESAIIRIALGPDEMPEEWEGGIGQHVPEEIRKKAYLYKALKLPNLPVPKQHDECSGVGIQLCPTCFGAQVDESGAGCQTCQKRGNQLCEGCGGSGHVEEAEIKLKPQLTSPVQGSDWPVGKVEAKCDSGHEFSSDDAKGCGCGLYGYLAKESAQEEAGGNALVVKMRIEGKVRTTSMRGLRAQYMQPQAIEMPRCNCGKEAECYSREGMVCKDHVSSRISVNLKPLLRQIAAKYGVSVLRDVNDPESEVDFGTLTQQKEGIVHRTAAVVFDPSKPYAGLPHEFPEEEWIVEPVEDPLTIPEEWPGEGPEKLPAKPVEVPEKVPAAVRAKQAADEDEQDGNGNFFSLTPEPPPPLDGAECSYDDGGEAVSYFMGKPVCIDHLKGMLEEAPEKIELAELGARETVGPARLRYQEVSQGIRRDVDRGEKSLFERAVEEALAKESSRQVEASTCAACRGTGECPDCAVTGDDDCHCFDGECEDCGGLGWVEDTWNTGLYPLASRGAAEGESKAGELGGRAKGLCLRCGREVFEGDAIPFGEDWSCTNCASTVATNPDLYRLAAAAIREASDESDWCPSCGVQVPTGEDCPSCGYDWQEPPDEYRRRQADPLTREAVAYPKCSSCGTFGYNLAGHDLLRCRNCGSESTVGAVMHREAAYSEQDQEEEDEDLRRRAIEDGVPIIVEHDGRAWAVRAVYPDGHVTLRRCVSEYAAHLALRELRKEARVTEHQLPTYREAAYSEQDQEEEDEDLRLFRQDHGEGAKSPATHGVIHEQEHS